MDREKLKAKIHRFVEYEAQETGKTPQEVLRILIKGQEMRIQSQNITNSSQTSSINNSGLSPRMKIFLEKVKKINQNTINNLKKKQQEQKNSQN